MFYWKKKKKKLEVNSDNEQIKNKSKLLQEEKLELKETL